MQDVVMGLNCSHDAAACIAVNGKIVAAIAEERLTRIKHQAGFPNNSIEYCLKEAGIDATQLKKSATIVVNQLPPADFDREVRSYFPNLTSEGVIVNPSHHLLHASYAQLFLRGTPGVVLVVDGSGYSYLEHARRNSPLLGAAPPYLDMWEALTAYDCNAESDLAILMKEWGEWKELGLLRFPSLGHMYSLAAQKIFGSWTHAGKVMGLAPYGDPARLGISEIVKLTPSGIVVDTEWILKIPRIPSCESYEKTKTACDLAALVQAELERGLLHLCTLLRRRSSAPAICLSGGVALNSVFNGQLHREKLFENIYVTPAAGDSGVAIGGAVYGYKLRRKQILRFAKDSEFLGKEYDLNQIDAAIDSVKADLTVAVSPSVINQAAEDISAGLLVGWFEGGSEFGPRALGHRSILADARNPQIKVALNSAVKFREAFRPYAAAVLEEYANDWFEQDVESPHMLMVATVRPSRRNVIPAVVHYDNTCRLQTLNASFNGGLRSIVQVFHSHTNVPLVLNTSLNIHGEPTSETPHDAIQVLLRSGLDVLFIGRYRLTKTYSLKNASLNSHRAVPAAPFTVRSFHSSHTGARDASIVRAVEQGNRRLPLSADETLILENLGLLDDDLRCDALSRIMNCSDILAVVQDLVRKGILTFVSKTSFDR